MYRWIYYNQAKCIAESTAIKNCIIKWKIKNEKKKCCYFLICIYMKKTHQNISPSHNLVLPMQLQNSLKWIIINYIKKKKNHRQKATKWASRMWHYLGNPIFISGYYECTRKVPPNEPWLSIVMDGRSEPDISVQ